MIKENPDFGLINDRLLVISLGAGSGKKENKYTAKKAAKWGVISWLYEQGSSPIIDAFTEAGNDIVDYHNSVVFNAFRSEDNYLRIQVSDKSSQSSPFRDKIYVHICNNELVFLKMKRAFIPAG